MAWHDPDGWLTYFLGPNLPAIIILFLTTLLIPVGLHLLIFRQRAPSQPPSFLVLGPSGAGKTSLVTHVSGF
jgi:signal recognition particle receptor subunit beta